MPFSKKMFGRRAALAGVAAVLLASALPQAATAQSVTGQYRAEGMNANGSRYTGTVVVAQNGTQLRLNWTVGSSQYMGSGTRNGDILWIDWGSAHPVVYVKMPNGELHGTWDNGRALERLIPLR